jgi:(p)ppGpp synthase/HD superfamily hydrolase
MNIPHLENVAKEIAKSRHSGMVDLLGVDYFSGHLTSVANGVLGDSILVAIAYLHDVIEDTDISPANLSNVLIASSDNMYDASIVKDVVDAVVAMSKVSGETYNEYLARVASNPLSVKVKIADIMNNMDESRGIISDHKFVSRRVKYSDALVYLRGIDSQ